MSKRSEESLRRFQEKRKRLRERAAKRDALTKKPPPQEAVNSESTYDTEDFHPDKNLDKSAN